MLGTVDFQIQHVVVSAEDICHLADQFVPDPCRGEGLRLCIEWDEDIVEQRLEVRGQQLPVGAFLPRQFRSLAQHCQPFDLVPP